VWLEVEGIQREQVSAVEVARRIADVELEVKVEVEVGVEIEGSFEMIEDGFWEIETVLCVEVTEEAKTFSDCKNALEAERIAEEASLRMIL
jgi:hypothetical protein